MSIFDETRYHIRKRGKYFYWKRPDEKTFHSTKKTNKSDARAYIAKILKEGEEVRHTVAEYAKDFFVWDKCTYIKRQIAKGKSQSKKWAQSRRSHLIMYIFPKWGKYKMDSINAIKWENWLIKLPLANGTKNSITHTMNIIFKEARREGVIKYNQFTDVEALANNTKNRDIYTQEDIDKLFPESHEETFKIWGNQYFATLFFTMLTTGMRVGEIIALQWKNVYLDKNAIHIMQAVKNDNTIGTTKNKENRVVIIPDVTVNSLNEWKAESHFTDDNDFVFHGLDIKDPRKPIHRKTVLDKLKKAFINAKLEVNGRNLVVHSFRHTFNTRYRNFLPVESLQSMIGHKNEKMTDHYDQATVDDKLKRLLPVKDTINEIWNKKDKEEKKENMDKLEKLG